MKFGGLLKSEEEGGIVHMQISVSEDKAVCVSKP